MLTMMPLLMMVAALVLMAWGWTLISKLAIGMLAAVRSPPQQIVRCQRQAQKLRCPRSSPQSYQRLVYGFLLSG